MGHRCCSKQKVKRGLWSPEEDEKLIKHITTHGHGSWSSVPKLAGLQRCGKSCRLRWINYLRPDLKRGSFTAEEEQIIIDVHRILGNRWAQIAKHLPGRTDNEVKNFWNSCIKKKLISQGLDPKTHNLLSSHKRASMMNNKATCNNNNNNNTTSSASQIHQEQTFTVFNANSQIIRSEAINRPPVLTVPQAPAVAATGSPPPQQTMAAAAAIPMPNSHEYHQNPNVDIWNGGNDQNSSNETSVIFPYGSSIEGTLLSQGFNLLEDQSHCIFGSSAMVEVPFDPPRMMEEEQQREKENICGMEIDKIIDDGPGEVHDMDASVLDSPGFDLGFVETTLMSGAMCRELSSMDDFAWNF